MKGGALFEPSGAHTHEHTDTDTTPVLLLSGSRHVPEAGAPNKPGTEQNEDEEENRIPRTNWNSKGAQQK